MKLLTVATVAAIGIGFFGASVRADVLYVSDSMAGKIWKISGDGTRSVFASGLNNPSGLAFDSSGNLYATSGLYGVIYKITPEGTRSNFVSYLGQRNSEYFAMTELAFNAFGELLATGGLRMDHGILRYSSSGTELGLFGVTSPGWAGGIAFDRLGNLYVSTTANTIEKFTAAGVRTTFSTGLSSPQDIAFDFAGNLYVANYNSNTITKIDSNGVSSVFADGGTGLSNPSGLAFDLAGNLYVSNSGNARVLKFTPTGESQVFAEGVASFTASMAFTTDGGVPIALPVPEPSTALFGIAAIAVMISARLSKGKRRSKVLNS